MSLDASRASTRASSLSPKFTELEKRDLTDLFRVHDFSKVSRVDSSIATARERGLSANDVFNDLYKQYHILPLPDSEAVLERMRTAVPASTPEERAAAVRRAEIRALKDSDALQDLKREVKRRQAEESTAITAQDAAPAETNPLQDAIRKLRHVDPTSADSIANSVEKRPSQPHGAALVDSSERRGVKDLIGSLEASAAPTSGSSTAAVVTQTAVPEQPHRPPTPPKTVADAPVREPPAREQPTATVQFDRAPIDNDARAAKLSSAPSRATMDGIIEADVREWVANVVGDTFNSSVLSATHLVDALRDGVVLSVLLQKLQSPPVPDDEVRVPKRTTGFFARDNVAQFIIQARKQFNLVDAQLFTDSDLCDDKGARQVVTCLMAIARIAYHRGTTSVAPSLVLYEKEIEQSAAARLTNEELTDIVEAAQQDEAACCHAEAPDPESLEETTDKEGVLEETTAEAGEAVSEHDTLEHDTVQQYVEPTDVSTTPEQPTRGSVSTDRGDSPTDKPPETSEPTLEGTDATEAPHASPAAESSSAASSAPRKGPLVVRKPEPAQKPLRYFARHWDFVDVALANILNEHYAAHPSSPWRFRGLASKGGEYVVYNTANMRLKKLLFVRLIHQSVVVRQSQAPGGPVWMPLTEYLTRLEEEELP